MSGRGGYFIPVQDRMATVLFWGKSESFLRSSVQILRTEFGFNPIAKHIGDPPLYVSEVGVPIAPSSDLIAFASEYRRGINNLIVLLAPVAITTPFGHPIVGESKDDIIILSTSQLSQPSLPRLLRHEVGHYFGLAEHLDCVMSPYHVDDPRFCSHCIHHLETLGVKWNPALSTG